MYDIEVLLAGPFRTGKRCAATWLKNQNSHFNIYTTSGGAVAAKEAFPMASIIVDDYNGMNYHNSRKMFERWKKFTEMNRFSDNQQVCVSRPDLIVYTPLQDIIDKFCSDGRPAFMVIDELKFGNDVLFFCTFGTLKRLIQGYTDWVNKTDLEETSFAPHEYLYYFAKQENSVNFSTPVVMCRPNVPIDLPLDDIETVYKYVMEWDNFILLYSKKDL